MIVAYDSFNYSRFWQGREYEDLAEKGTLQALFKEIPKKENLIDVGAGFGRLASAYASQFKKCLLVDPSERLLKAAQTKLKKYPNLYFKKGPAQKLPAGSKQFDVAIMIRISHHLPMLEKPLQEVSRVLKPKGFLIFEFANKINFKASLKAIFHAKMDFLFSHQPTDVFGRENIPFYNYHPNQIKTLLLANGFTIKDSLSVSNFRFSLLKKIVPLSYLLFIEKTFSSLCAHFSFLAYFGPSIFVLAQKTPQCQSPQNFSHS